MTQLMYNVRKLFRTVFGTQKLHARIEQLDAQLAGCSVAAFGGIHDVVTRDMWGWSPSYQDVLNLRIKYDSLLETAKRNGFDFAALQQLRKDAKY